VGTSIIEPISYLNENVKIIFEDYI